MNFWHLKRNWICFLILGNILNKISWEDLFIIFLSSFTHCLILTENSTKLFTPKCSVKFGVVKNWKPALHSKCFSLLFWLIFYFFMAIGFRAFIRKNLQCTFVFWISSEQILCVYVCFKVFKGKFLGLLTYENNTIGIPTSPCVKISYNKKFTLKSKVIDW